MDKLAAVFRDAFGLPGLEIDDLIRSNLAARDSLAHVKLSIGIEEEFDVKFTIPQVANIRPVEEFRRLLAENPVA